MGNVIMVNVDWIIVKISTSFERQTRRKAQERKWNDMVMSISIWTVEFISTSQDEIEDFQL